jgi:hypothetical protein
MLWAFLQLCSSCTHAGCCCVCTAASSGIQCSPLHAHGLTLVCCSSGTS